MADGFALKFPVFALLFKDSSGVVKLRHGEDIFLPIFSDDDSVQTYLERSEVKECVVQKINTAAALADFLETPPTRGPNPKDSYCDRVIIDPLDPGPRQYTIFDTEQLIRSLQ